MNASDLNATGLNTRQASNPTPDYGVAPVRSGRQCELAVVNLMPGKSNLADEGSYWVGQFSQPGTTTSFFSNISNFSATGASAVWQNTSYDKRVAFDFLRFLWTAASTGGTSVQAALITDILKPSQNSNPDDQHPVQPNLDVNYPQAMETVYHSASNAIGWVLNSTPQAKTRSRFTIKPGNTAALDECLVVFGGKIAQGGATGAGAGFRVVHAPPLILGPRTQLELHLWLPSSTVVPALEFEYGFWVR